MSSAQGQRYIIVRLQFGQTIYESEKATLNPGSVELKIEGTGPEFIFSYAQAGDFAELERADARFLSTETVGWFTGVYVGLYATGNGKDSDAIASYGVFEYIGED